MTAEIIQLGRVIPAAPSPHVQHYIDQARLAWFDRMVNCLEAGERIFGGHGSGLEQLEWLAEAREITKGVENL